MKEIGFIGSGNMAGAIMGGIIKRGIFRPEEIIASDASPAAREKTARELGVEVTEDNRKAAELSRLLVLSVKPQFYAAVIGEIRDLIRPGQIVITIAPGWTVEKLEQAFGKELKLVRTMPNTPALVLEGITAVCPNSQITPEDLERVLTVLNSFGKAEVVEERLMDAVVSVSGSSPAYVYMFIEALADGAVADGMPRAQAYEFAARAVYGSAKMVLETGRHPGELKDMVCSPAGTTIEGVRVLEEKGFRGCVLDAMKACTKKSKEM